MHVSSETLSTNHNTTAYVHCACKHCAPAQAVRGAPHAVPRLKAWALGYNEQCAGKHRASAQAVRSAPHARAKAQGWALKFYKQCAGRRRAPAQTVRGAPHARAKPVAQRALPHRHAHAGILQVLQLRVQGCRVQALGFSVGARYQQSGSNALPDVTRGHAIASGRARRPAHSLGSIQLVRTPGCISSNPMDQRHGHAACRLACNDEIAIDSRKPSPQHACRASTHRSFPGNHAITVPSQWNVINCLSIQVLKNSTLGSEGGLLGQNDVLENHVTLHRLQRPLQRTCNAIHVKCFPNRSPLDAVCITIPCRL